MPRLIAWRPLAELVADALVERTWRLKTAAETIERETAEYIAAVESNFQAAALLDGAGIDLTLERWSSARVLDVQLGFFPLTRAGKKALAAAVIAVRRALSARRLTVRCKSVDEGGDKVLIAVTLQCEEFPGVRIHYSVPPARGRGAVKCRVVTRRYKTLVCERE